MPLHPPIQDRHYNQRSKTDKSQELTLQSKCPRHKLLHIAEYIDVPFLSVAWIRWSSLARQQIGAYCLVWRPPVGKIWTKWEIGALGQIFTCINHMYHNLHTMSAVYLLATQVYPFFVCYTWCRSEWVLPGSSKQWLWELQEAFSNHHPLPPPVPPRSAPPSPS